MAGLDSVNLTALATDMEERRGKKRYKGKSGSKEEMDSWKIVSVMESLYLWVPVCAAV